MSTESISSRGNAWKSTKAPVCRSVVGKGGNYAVLRGSSLRLNCIPKVSEPQELREAGKTYVWTDEAGKELIDARYIKLNSGDLEIVNAHVGDSGIYKCTIQSSAKQVSPP
ncbi:unnamed protein product, partial [Larinioides sclopetarius]